MKLPGDVKDKNIPTKLIYTQTISKYLVAPVTVITAGPTRIVYLIEVEEVNETSW